MKNINNFKRTMSRKSAKRILVLALTMMLCLTALAFPASAASAPKDGGPLVRVNGYLVNFPDQKPFIDKNGRTLIPVRFVAEELNAAVNWDDKTKTAIVQRDGMSIYLPIGSNRMTVVDANGVETIVTMDTAAENVGGRTMVPIRYVAETLGAWVGYSNTYRTVQIYQDILSPQEIDSLHKLAFRHKWHDGKLGIKRGPSPHEDLNESAFYGEFKHDYGGITFEGMYDPITMMNPYDGQTWTEGINTHEELANMFVRYAQSGIGQRFTDKPNGVTASFRTDASCIFTAPNMEGEGANYVMYGYLTLHFAEDANISAYKNWFSMASTFGDIRPGTAHTYAIEVNYMVSGTSPYPRTLGVFNRTNGVEDSWD